MSTLKKFMQNKVQCYLWLVSEKKQVAEYYVSRDLVFVKNAWGYVAP